MYGYLKARPTKRHVFCEEEHQNARKTASNLAVNPQSAGYLSWEGISYFFGRLWTNGLYNEPSSSPPNNKLVETQVDSDLIKAQKRQDILGLLGVMENTMEYTVTAYDTLPKIALKFDVTPSQLSSLNRLTIRTLYPGQVLRVPCPKPTEPCSECCQVTKVVTDAPQSMTMNHHEVHKTPVAKRVSFDDIDEDVLETFIKVKSKYITDGQGVVKGFLLITPHAVIFHPDVNEILVVDQGIENYKVHFNMDSVACAGLFDDIASMIVHNELDPGHFFLDKPLMEWLGDPHLKPLEDIKEEDSSTTLHASTDPSISPEQSMESFCDTTGSIQERGTAETSATMLDTSVVNRNIERVEEENPPQNFVEGENLENENSENVLKNDSETGYINLQERADETSSLEQDIGLIGNRTSEEITKKSYEPETEMSFEINMGQDVANSVVSNELQSSCDNICNDDVILSSSQNPGLPNMNKSFGITGESGQVTNNERPLEMSSTPKLPPYRDVEGEQEIEMDKEGYREGISKDSGIHESKEDVLEGDSGDHGWINQQDALPVKEMVPRESTHYVDMPKYLCVKIKKAFWRQHRPMCCRFAHKLIQETVDERREYWFSIPSDSLLEVYGFFLEWCPAIHDGDTDDDAISEEDFVGSLDSEYSVITNPKDDDESFEVVDNFYSSSFEKENVQSNVQARKRSRSYEKKKRKSESKQPGRKESSWSMCSMEEPLMPEVVGKSEILTDPRILQLSQCLPSRTIGHSWHLIYSTYLHGISLKTLYRALAQYDTPALLVILDDSHQIFGAFASSPFAVSDHFYGTGECFLYTFHPHFKVFRWTGENNFFIKGDMDSLAFGGGQGTFGLWLDEDLFHGSSHPCKTFNNELLTVKEDFLCSGLEIWCFE